MRAGQKDDVSVAVSNQSSDPLQDRADAGDFHVPDHPSLGERSGHLVRPKWVLADDRLDKVLVRSDARAVRRVHNRDREVQFGDFLDDQAVVVEEVVEPDCSDVVSVDRKATGVRKDSHRDPDAPRLRPPTGSPRTRDGTSFRSPAMWLASREARGRTTSKAVFAQTRCGRCRVSDLVRDQSTATPAAREPMTKSGTAEFPWRPSSDAPLRHPL